MSAPGPAPLGALALFLAVTLAQRTGELLHSAANVRRLVARGAREHPNYLAVALELAAGPLVFGAWRTAMAISLLDLVALGIRIRAEEAALRDPHPLSSRGAFLP